MKKLILILPLIFVFSSCAKRYDWVCTCEVYTATTDTIQTKVITNKNQSDANEECSKFGESAAGTGGAHDCSITVK